MLFAVWIEIDHDQNDIVTRCGHLPVKNDRLVIGLVKSQIILELKGAVRFSNLVQTRDPILDVAGAIPIALLVLIFLRMDVLLATRQRFALAKFVAAVDAVKR